MDFFYWDVFPLCTFENLDAWLVGLEDDAQLMGDTEWGDKGVGELFVISLIKCLPTNEHFFSLILKDHNEGHTLSHSPSTLHLL
jgi:hypothetical protein